jgi:hypothetical protein
MCYSIWFDSVAIMSNKVANLIGYADAIAYWCLILNRRLWVGDNTRFPIECLVAMVRDPATFSPIVMTVQQHQPHRLDVDPRNMSPLLTDHFTRVRFRNALPVNKGVLLRILRSSGINRITVNASTKRRLFDRHALGHSNCACLVESVKISHPHLSILL